jgi:hypothetical protein
LQPN